jgi:hypothetical protein
MARRIAGSFNRARQTQRFAVVSPLVRPRRGAGLGEYEFVSFKPNNIGLDSVKTIHISFRVLC